MSYDLNDIDRFVNSHGVRVRHDADQLSIWSRDKLLEIQTVAYDREYPDFDARVHIPLDLKVSPGAEEWGYDIYDGRGNAEWVGRNSTDVPRVDVGRKREIFGVHPFAAGYGWTIFELATSQFTGSSLDDRRADRAREACAEKEHRALLYGEAGLRIPGFVNNPAVPAVTVPNGNWLFGATAAQIVEDLNYLVDRPWLGTIGKKRANTVLLPLAHFRKTQTLPYIESATVFRIFSDMNPGITLGVLNELETAGPSGAPRAVVYNKDPKSLSGVVPIPFRQLDPQVRGFEVFVACWQTVGGTVFLEPRTAVYGDGI